MAINDLARIWKWMKNQAVETAVSTTHFPSTASTFLRKMNRPTQLSCVSPFSVARKWDIQVLWSYQPDVGEWFTLNALILWRFGPLWFGPTRSASIFSFGAMGWAEQPSFRPTTFSFGSWAEWAGPNSPVFDPVLGENIISTRHLGSPTPLISKAEPGVGMGLDNYKEVHYPNLHRKRRQVMA